MNLQIAISVHIHQPLTVTRVGSQEGVWFEDLKDPISEEEVGFYFFRSKKVSWKMRMFILDRIKMLKVTDERFTIPKDFKLDDFMRHSLKAKRRRRMGMAAWNGHFGWLV